MRAELPTREEIADRLCGVVDKRDVQDVLSRLTLPDLAAEMQRRGARLVILNENEATLLRAEQ